MKPPRTGERLAISGKMRFSRLWQFTRALDVQKLNRHEYFGFWSIRANFAVPEKVPDS